MKYFILLALVAVARAGYLAAPAVVSTGSSVQTRTQDAFGNYAFGYDEGHATGGTFRRESGHGGAAVVGSYGLRDADGRARVVNYVADAAGFRANVQTNEPGVDPVPDPAATLVNKAGVPAVPVPAVAAVAHAPAYAAVAHHAPAYAAAVHAPAVVAPVGAHYSTAVHHAAAPVAHYGGVHYGAGFHYGGAVAHGFGVPHYGAGFAHHKKVLF